MIPEWSPDPNLTPEQNELIRKIYQRAGNAVDIDTNTTNITTNTADIATNTAAIAAGFFVDRGDPATGDADLTGALTYTLVANGAWHDLDLSAIAPDGTKAILLRCGIFDAGTTKLSMQIRTNGNTNAINQSIFYNAVLSVWYRHDKIVAPDSSRVVEYKISNGMDNAEITVGGWWI